MKNIVKVGINRYIVIGVILANGHDFTFKHNKNLCKDRNNNKDWGKVYICITEYFLIIKVTNRLIYRIKIYH